MRWRIRRSVVRGEARVPGDKSIGHRALLFAALARGHSEIRNLPSGDDVRSTGRCLGALGVEIDSDGETTIVRSNGRLREPSTPLECGNSGTTMRLLSGILAGQRFHSCLTGDESLSARPMSRVVEPLVEMGARIESQDGRAPLDIHGNRLRAIDYATPVASAQIKSAILLAGLFAEGTTTVREPVLSRDHTERMLAALGVPISSTGPVHSVEGSHMPRPFETTIPADPSSAAFLTTAACLTGGDVQVPNVLLNPTRSGLSGVLKSMGAGVEEVPRSESLGEVSGEIRGRGKPSTAMNLLEAAVPTLIDEVPLLVLAATQVEGCSEIRGVAELRIKETDRISATTEGLNKMGADIEKRPDGFVVHGPTPLCGVPVDSCGDHRIAMMLAVAGLIADGETVIEGAECASISWPGFAQVLASLGADVGVE